MHKYELYYTTEIIRHSEMINNSTGMSLAEKQKLYSNMILELKRGEEKLLQEKCK
tara:strand:- start:543 stop:707 length:165 start_codon:yes stop_codon:yes gene_type:complete